MPRLQPLRAEDAAAVLAFESANRAFFARSISDRGNDYFASFPERHHALMAEQKAGLGAYYVLVDEEGAVLGRFNLYFSGDGVAELGYRVAEQVTGRGVASATVRDLCRLAVSRHGVSTLRAATSHANVASQRVLRNAGFVEVGPAEPAEIGGKQGSWYQLELGPASPGEA